MNARPIKRFADVDIAKTGDDPLVQEQQLDRRGPASQSSLQLVDLKVERLRSERLERRPNLELIGGKQVERSEPSGIVKRDAAALFSLNQEMVVFLDLSRVDPPPAGHAEVEDQGVSPIGIDEPVLCPSAQRPDTRSGQALAEIDRHRTTQIGAPGLDRGDAPAEQHALQAANGGLDFREFRHAGHMAEALQGG